MKKNPSNGRFYVVLHTLLEKIVGFIMRIKVIGTENEPSFGGFVVAANHIGASDPVFLCYAFKKNQVRFMAKKELFKIPLLAQLIKGLGAFPIDRSGSDVGAIKNAVKLVKEGKCLGLFPQGHRYPGTNPRETKTKNGVALIATRAACDIIPVFIWRKNNKPRLFSRTYVIIGERISFAELGYNKDDAGEYARISYLVFDRICTLGEEFSKKYPDGKLK